MTDPTFTKTFANRSDLAEWVRQRCLYPDPAPDARLRALADIRQAMWANLHLYDEQETIDAALCSKRTKGCRAHFIASMRSEERV